MQQVKKVTVVNTKTGQRKAVVAGDPKYTGGDFQLETAALHRQLRDATKGNSKLLNDPAFVRGVFTMSAQNTAKYPDASTGLVPPGFGNTHQTIQDTIAEIRKRLEALKAEDAAAEAPLTPTAPAGVTPVSAPNKGESLAQYYARLASEQGLAEMNTSVAGLEGAIRGAEGDIQTEATRSGGEVTASQLEGLKATRTTPLYNKLHTLYSLRAAKEDYINNVVALTKEDRQAASDRLDKELNLTATIAELQQQEDQLSYQQWRDIQTMAQQQVQLLVSTDSIANQSDASLTELARSSGYSVDSLKALRKASKRKLKAENENNELARQQALLQMEDTRSQIRTRGAGISLQREELNFRKQFGGLTPSEAARDPMLAFQLIGGRRDQNEVGGYSFFDKNGKPITVDEVMRMVPGSTRADFLQGSRDKADEQYSYTKEQRQAILSLTDNVRQDPDIKNFVIIRDGFNTVQTGAAARNSAGDMAMIYGYMKLLDPGSAVKEGEYATAENAGGVPDKVRKQYNKVLNGSKLSEGQRQRFVKQAKEQYNVKLPSYRGAYDMFKRQADAYGIDPNLILRDFGISAASDYLSGKGY